jgi:hypothetical protein
MLGNPILTQEYGYMLSTRPGMVNDYYAALLNSGLVPELTQYLLDKDPQLVLGTNSVLNDTLLPQYLGAIAGNRELFLSLINYAYALNRSLLIRDLGVVVQNRGLASVLVSMEPRALTEVLDYAYTTNPNLVISLDEELASDPGRLSLLLEDLLQYNPGLLVSVLSKISSTNPGLSSRNLLSLLNSGKVNAFLDTINLTLNTDLGVVTRSLAYLTRSPNSLVEFMEPIVNSPHLLISLMQSLVNQDPGLALGLYGALASRRPDLAVSMTITLLINKPGLLYTLVSRSWGGLVTDNH